MCGLCGILGGMRHWTETQSAPEAFAARAQTHTSARERLDRTALVNKVLSHYRLRLKQWSGSSYMLQGSTGKTELVDNLAQMWAQAERMTGQQFDPLDDALIADLTSRDARAR